MTELFPESVGGTTEWKWSTMRTWAASFKRVHVGRVNNVARCQECYEAGVESVDGTGWQRDPSDPTKLDALEDWFASLPVVDGARRPIMEVAW